VAVSTAPRTALITGGSRGIGRGIATALAEAGVDVAIGYRQDRAAALEVLAVIRAYDRRGVALRDDLTRRRAPERLVERTVKALGRLDILVANAGVLVPRLLIETTYEDYEAQSKANVQATFFLVREAAKRMIEQGTGGVIVLISSDAASKPFRSLGAYCVSKAAVSMLARVAAAELAEHGIRVNVVAPGTTETDMNRALLSDEKTREELLRSVALRRPGTPRDVAEAVRFLVSEEAAFVTAASLAVDGGSSGT
jgi:NAD(P)-dependent dehydrogenase (short-subunit alcohol dehydrogenase family)